MNRLFHAFPPREPARASRRWLAALLVACSMSCASLAAAQAAAPRPGTAPPRIASQTRSMVMFSGLEADLAAALSRRDGKATNRLLSQDFEFRSAGAEMETARADWLASPASRLGGEPSGLSVHQFPDLAVVSFTRAAAVRAGRAPRAYIVDVWQRVSEGWQLLARYQSDLPAAAAPRGDLVPTGKG